MGGKRDGKEGLVGMRGLSVGCEAVVCCPEGGPGHLSRGQRTARQRCFSRRVLLAGIMRTNRISEGSARSSLSQRCSQHCIKVPFSDFEIQGDRGATCG